MEPARTTALATGLAVNLPSSVARETRAVDRRVVAAEEIPAVGHLSLLPFRHCTSNAIQSAKSENRFKHDFPFPFIRASSPA